jgi:hypothetical protein
LTNYNFGNFWQELEPGVPYIHTDEVVNKLRAMSVKVINHGDLNQHRKMPWSLRDETGNIAILITGGIGDAICLEPTLRLLKSKAVNVTIYGYHNRLNILANSPEMWELNRLPVMLKGFPPLAWHLRGVPYDWEDHTIAMPLIMAQLAGLDYPAGERPRIYPRPQDLQVWSNLCGDVRRPLIGLQIGAAIAKRSYPPPMLAELATELSRLGQVMLLGTSEQYQAAVQPYLAWYPDGKRRVMSAAGMCHDPLDLAALIAQLDILVTPDTGALHIAGALPKPVATVGLTTVYPASYAAGTHPRYYPVFPSRDEVGCSPCSGHGHQDCSKTNDLGVPICWAALTPKRIASVVKQAMEEL